jgi:phage gp36-like protein
MTYATPQDLIDRLGLREATAISDRNGTGLPDTAVLTTALAEAEVEVNSYLGRRYLLPLTSADTNQVVVPSLLKRVVIDIARYRQTGTEIMETDSIRNRYKDAIRLLEQIAEGKVSVGNLLPAPSGGPAALGGATATRTGEKTFGDLSGVL